MARSPKDIETAPSPSARRRQVEELLSDLEGRIRSELVRLGLDGAASKGLDEVIAEGERLHVAVWHRSRRPRRKALRIEELTGALTDIRDCRIALAANDPWRLTAVLVDAVAHWLAGPASAAFSSRKGSTAGGESRSEAERNAAYAREYIELRDKRPTLTVRAFADQIVRRDALTVQPDTMRKAISRALATLKK